VHTLIGCAFGEHALQDLGYITVMASGPVIGSDTSIDA
jgi:hypothetical protein